MQKFLAKPWRPMFLLMTISGLAGTRRGRDSYRPRLDCCDRRRLVAGYAELVFFPEMDSHPSGQRVVAVPGLVAPNGVAWIEMGGTESEMSNWLGMPASNLPFRFNGRIPGIHAVAVKIDNGEVVIRRNVAVATT